MSHRSLKTVRRFATGLVCASLFLGGCGGGGDNKTGSTSPPPGQQEVLSSKSVVISQSPGGKNPVISQDATSMVLSGIYKNIVPGTIIVSTVGNGALRNVKSVAISGGNTVLQTTQASLPEAFDSMHVRVPLEFSQDTIGNLQSTVPGLTFKWLPGATSSTNSLSPHGVKYNKLEVDFGKLTLSADHGITIDGSATFTGNPEFDCDINRAPGDLLPSIAYFHGGVSAGFHGSVTIASKYGGNVGANQKWFEKPVGRPIVVGYLVFVPELTISSSLEGTSAGKITHTQSVDINASASETYTRGSGWTSDKSLVPTMTATESDVDNSYKVDFKPVSIKLAFKVYDIAGPYVEMHDSVEAEGSHDVENNIEGIKAEVTAASGGEIGIEASTPEELSKLFEASWTPLLIDFDTDKVTLFEHFFPFTGTAAINVGDNGPAPDDVFAVSVDGVALGQTDKGGTGAFRLGDLVPGTHTLTITCLDDGADGADIGTLGISLNDGVTFTDGTTALSDELQLNETKNYSINVPSQAQISHVMVRMPKSRILVEHPRR